MNLGPYLCVLILYFIGKYILWILLLFHKLKRSNIKGVFGTEENIF